MANRSNKPAGDTAVIEPPVPPAGTPMTPEEIAAQEASAAAVPADPDANPAQTSESVPAEAPAEAEEVIDLSGIDTAVAAIFGPEATPTDVSDPTVLDYSGVVTAYNGLTRKGKAAATRHMETNSRTLLEGGNFESARVWLLSNKATKADKPKGESKPRTPADVTTPVVTKLAAFQLAYGALTANLPEGISEDWQAQVTALFESEQPAVESVRAWMNGDAETRGDMPDVSEAAAMAAKIAFKATRKPYGPRHDVGTHIEQVFADLESGTFLSDSEIAGKESLEYGDAEGETGKCSTSAVTARLKAVTDQDKPLAEGLSVETREDKFGVLKA